MKTTYYATFSNGPTVKRSSHNPYMTAVAVFHKETGKLGNITFSAKLAPSPDWTGLIYPLYKSMSPNERSSVKHRNEGIKAEYRIEVVKLSRKEPHEN